MHWTIQLFNATCIFKYTGQLTCKKRTALTFNIIWEVHAPGMKCVIYPIYWWRNLSQQGRQARQLFKQLFQTWKRATSEVPEQLSFLRGRMACSVHLFLRRAQSELRDAVRGRLPVVPPSHWRSVGVLHLEPGEARRRSLAPAYGQLQAKHPPAADRGRPIHRTYFHSFKSGQINRSMYWTL